MRGLQELPAAPPSIAVSGTTPASQSGRLLPRTDVANAAGMTGLPPVLPWRRSGISPAALPCGSRNSLKT